jgi:hypothetical protein
MDRLTIYKPGSKRLDDLYNLFSVSFEKIPGRIRPDDAPDIVNSRITFGTLCI